MPKIISGSLKGRNIKGYDIPGTRPTMDRVKESVFAMIQNYLCNAVVLDLFAGSGNLGIESLSNGASKVYFNDKNIQCIKAINENLKTFNIEKFSVVTKFDYLEALNWYEKEHIQFDLVFLDPPYKDLINDSILELLIKKKLLKDNSLVICESTKQLNYQNSHLVVFKEKKYGDKIIIIYQYQ